MPDAPVAWGELFDKVTILQIKAERMTAPAALANVQRELSALQRIEATAPASDDLAGLKDELAAVNLALWDIEDAIRDHEQAGDFGPRFVELARSVYRQNDRRAAIKRRINDLLRSDIVEEKSYRGAGD
jgi:hypothetical protein